MRAGVKAIKDFSLSLSLSHPNSRTSGTRIPNEWVQSLCCCSYSKENGLCRLSVCLSIYLSVVYLGRCLRCALFFCLSFMLHSVFMNLGRYIHRRLDWTGLDSNGRSVKQDPLLSFRFTWRLYLRDRGSTLTAWVRSRESSEPDGLLGGEEEGERGGGFRGSMLLSLISQEWLRGCLVEGRESEC